MMSNYSNKIQFLAKMRVHQTRHSGATLLDHLTGVYLQLKQWGQPRAVAEAGLFHSIYGTAEFPIETLSPKDRTHLRKVVGEDTERLVHLFCVMNRPGYVEALSTDAPCTSLTHRVTGEGIPVSQNEHRAMGYIILANWVEHLPRIPQERRYTKAPVYAHLVHYLDDPALAHVLPAERCAAPSLPLPAANGAH
jgi:hypothetical protein